MGEGKQLRLGVDPVMPGNWELIQGDCVALMQAMEPGSVDSIVTDPLYGLEFMGGENP